jgi:hypothetical protein
MITSDKYLAILDFVPQSDYFRFLLEDLSPGQVAHLKSEAIEEENFELCILIQEVELNYRSRFYVYFRAFDDGQCDQAEIVAFQKDGKTYYHADTFIKGKEDGQQVMLSRTENGWTSEKRGFNADLSATIGKSIEKYLRKFCLK